jgi:uncharacterized protein with HEPN domain
METDGKIWLYDVLNAIMEIESFFLDQPKTFEIYKTDIRTKRAIERNIEIIGESLNRILKLDPTIQITYSRQIVNTRNRIIHGYDSVSDEVMWGIVVKHLPVLQAEVELMLQEF